MHVAHARTVFEFAWLLTQDGTGGFEFAGNAFQVKQKDSGTASSIHVCLASDIRRVGHFV